MVLESPRSNPAALSLSLAGLPGCTTRHCTGMYMYMHRCLGCSSSPAPTKHKNKGLQKVYEVPCHLGPISRQPCHRRTAGYDALNIGHQMQLVLEAGNLQYPSLIGLALSPQRPRKVPPLANKDFLIAEGCRCKCRVGRVWAVADTPFPGAASVGPFREHPKGSKRPK